MSFAAYVAHELRTPLATQRALLELALGDPDADVATWREIGEDVLCACRQQERMLEACLALARSQDGPQRCESVDLAAIAAEALEAHDVSELSSVVALEPARTTGDPDLLERLAANLVSNAIRHNIAGGRIEVATRIESGNAVLSVANTGPHVPVDDVQRLFQPFQRRSSSHGIGLGLAIVKAVAGAHNAFISVRPRTDGGLEIHVGFPVGRPRRAWRSRARTAAAIIATAGLALLAGGCGGSPSAGGSTNSQSPISQPLAFSHCMRDDGVTSFPDPNKSGVWPKSQVEVAAGNPKFQAASTACGHLLPNGGPGVPPTPSVMQQIRIDMVKFARCMHSDGVPNWPGPTPDPEGGGRFVFNPQAVGIDPNAPQISRKMRACDRVFPASIGVPPGAGQNP